MASVAAVGRGVASSRCTRSVDAREVRALLCMLVLLCVGAPRASAQQRIAHLELDDGRFVHGLVVQLDNSGVALRIDGKVVAFRSAQIRRCEFEEVEADDLPPPADSAAAADRPAAPGVEGAVPRRSRELWDARLHALDHMFPWLAPAEPSQWISLGVMLFALLTIFVHAAARLSATDRPSFGRAALLATWFLLTVLLQVALLPAGPGYLALAMAGNAVAAVLLFRLAYGLAAPAAGLALFLLCLQGGLLFAVLRLVDAMLRQVGTSS